MQGPGISLDSEQTEKEESNSTYVYGTDWSKLKHMFFWVEEKKNFLPCNQKYKSKLSKSEEMVNCIDGSQTAGSYKRWRYLMIGVYYDYRLWGRLLWVVKIPSIILLIILITLGMISDRLNMKIGCFRSVYPTWPTLGMLEVNLVCILQWNRRCVLFYFQDLEWSS